MVTIDGDSAPVAPWLSLLDDWDIKPGARVRAQFDNTGQLILIGVHHGGAKVIPISAGGTDATTKPGAITALNIYPVGSIYLSISPTNPGTLLGGTWQAWGAGRVPVGVDTSQPEFNTVQKIGGEKNHILTTAEIPAHNHLAASTSQATTTPSTGGVFVMSGGNNANLTAGGGATASGPAITSVTTTTTIQNTGGGGAHNNLPPYITCYMWLRTA